MTDSLPRIRVLDSDIAEKIAAGEVIERPSSVIKELIENSIDARATRIDVSLEEGGKKLIRISDDGHGIHENDVLVALQRHATSKIEQLSDLWNLSTMGFRGEALPSVAAISRMTIETQSKGGPGRKVYIEGGRVHSDETPLLKKNLNLDAASGTSISVEDLFYNVPARLKFQRSKSGESILIREMLEHFSLFHSHIAFSLSTEKRKTFQVDATADKLARVAQVFNAKPEDLEHFESSFENINVHGWLDRNSRAVNSKQIYVFANGRIVKDRLLQQAIIMALRPRMMEGEYPKIFLSVDVPPADIDVNVHPTKSEVRFRKSKDVFQVIHGLLSRVAAQNTKPYYSSTLPEIEAKTEPKQNLFFETQSQFKRKVDVHTLTSPAEPVASERNYDREIFASAVPVASSELTQEKPFQSMDYIGQLAHTYLLFQDQAGMVLIDQHAAHERIQYEKIKNNFFQSGLSPQPLLISITHKCSEEDLQVAMESVEMFQKLGFDIEPFGEDCLIIRSIPESLDADRALDLFRSLLEVAKSNELSDAATLKSLTHLSPKLERMLATLACHSSVRAGQALSAREAQSLVARMEQTESSLNCPHGRPASIRMSLSQIEGLFKR